MKRAYLWPTTAGRVAIGTAFKVDDLEVEYAGMVQTRPTLIGYMEGAPPVPSENLTRPLWKHPEMQDYLGYFNHSVVTLTQSDEVTYNLETAREDGTGWTKDMSAGFGAEYEGAASVGFWSNTMLFLKMTVGAHDVKDRLSTDSAALAKGAGQTKEYIEQLAFTGEWQPLRRATYPVPGRRFLSSNMGYGLVKSRVADLYLLKLRGTGSVVSTEVLPNPDIPEDWNLIMFPLEPTYTKNGTLDGMVGTRPDEHYPQAKQHRGSYFKPDEAYALQQRIEHAEKQLEAFYAQGSVKETRERTVRAGKGSLDSALPGLPSYDWGRRLSKRNLVNTYVWTADSGLFCEESQLLDRREEMFGAGFQSLTSEGNVFNMFASFGATGFFIDRDFLKNTTLNVSSRKTREDSSALSLRVEVEADGWLQTYMHEMNNGSLQPIAGYQDFDGYSGSSTPGKVDAYRFKTFYLAPHERNFRHFFRSVVRRDWLYTSNDPAAQALRSVRGAENGAWCLFHRVTYVSRIPEPFTNTRDEETSDPGMVAPNPDANAVLIALVQAELGAVIRPTTVQLGAAVDAVMGAGGSLSTVLSWWAAVAAAPQGALYTRLRRRVYEYMVKLYGAADPQLPGPIYLPVP
ncbi:MAG: hypothetical protein R3F14_35145 [Polyangiaceae bacterium]